MLVYQKRNQLAQNNNSYVCRHFEGTLLLMEYFNLPHTDWNNDLLDKDNESILYKFWDTLRNCFIASTCR